MLIISNNGGFGTQVIRTPFPLSALLIGNESNITLNHRIISIFGEDPSKNYLPSEMYNVLKPDFPDITENKVTNLLDNLVKQNNLQRILNTQMIITTTEIQKKEAK